MNGLINVSTDEQGSQVVSARELYAYLELADGQFTRWAKSNIEDNPFAIENADYQRFDTVVETPNGGKKAAIEYALRLDLAKKLCMVSKSVNGEKARDYFLDCEKKANALQKSLSIEEMIIAQAQSMIETKKELAEVKAQQAEVKAQQAAQAESIRMLEAKTTTTPDYFTVAGYANLNRINVGLKIASSVGQRASRLCKERGIPTESCPDPRFGVVNMYPSSVLKEVFNQPFR